MIGTNEGFENGLTVEHVLLSVTIVMDKTAVGQLDDSSARAVQRAIEDYCGVRYVDAKVLYNHTKIEHHPNHCECGICVPPKRAK